MPCDWWAGSTYKWSMCKACALGRSVTQATRSPARSTCRMCSGANVDAKRSRAREGSKRPSRSRLGRMARMRRASSDSKSSGRTGCER